MKFCKSLEKNLQARARCQTRFWVLTLTLINLAPLTSGYHQGVVAPPASFRPAGAQSNDQTITPIPFGELNGNEVYYASGAVPLADSRFLFCDNKSRDALFELDLAVDGQKKGRLIKRPLQGLAAGAVNDLEAMTIAEENGRRFVFVTSSFCVKRTKDEEARMIPSSGLLRVTVNS